MSSLFQCNFSPDPVLQYIENSRNGMQNGMQNRIAIIPEENKFSKRKIKGEKTKKPLIIYIYIYLIDRSPSWVFRCIFLLFYRDPVDPVVFGQGSRLPNFSFFAAFFGAQNSRHFLKSQDFISLSSFSKRLLSKVNGMHRIAIFQ